MDYEKSKKEVEQDLRDREQQSEHSNGLVFMKTVKPRQTIEVHNIDLREIKEKVKGGLK